MYPWICIQSQAQSYPSGCVSDLHPGRRGFESRVRQKPHLFFSEFYRACTCKSEPCVLKNSVNVSFYLHLKSLLHLNTTTDPFHWLRLLSSKRETQVRASPEANSQLFIHFATRAGPPFSDPGGHRGRPPRLVSATSTPGPHVSLPS